jgi:hypothetical protein
MAKSQGINQAHFYDEKAATKYICAETLKAAAMFHVQCWKLEYVRNCLFILNFVILETRNE